MENEDIAKEQAKALADLFPLTHTRKSVEWAYPSSTTATRFGYSDRGCWVIKAEDPIGDHLPVAISAYSSRDDALSAAKLIYRDWSFAFRYCHPADATH